MTVSAETNKAVYAGDGTTTPRSTSFLFAANAEVGVILVAADGGQTVWVESTDYTLVGAGTGVAGTLTPIVGPIAGTSLVIRLQPAITQTTLLPRGGTVSPSLVLQPMADKATRQILSLLERLDRALLGPITETTMAAIPAAADRADKYLTFDSSGDPTVTSFVGLAANISYDNSTSALVATSVQGALDEIDADLDTAQASLAAAVSELGTLPPATEGANRVLGINAANTAWETKSGFTSTLAGALAALSLIVTATVQVPYGTAGAPTFSFDDGTTGFYRSGTGQIGVSLQGTQGWNFSSSMFSASHANGPGLSNVAPSGTVPTILPRKDIATTGFGNSSGFTTFIHTGALVAQIQSTGIAIANGAGPQLMNEAASSTNPTLVANRADLDTGMGWNGTNEGALIGGGVMALRWGNGFIQVPGVASFADGSVGTPGINFNSDTDNGFAYINPDNWGAIAGGGWNLYFQTSQTYAAKNFLALDAAGPAFLNEGAGATNPTLVPNRVDLTTGWGSGGAANLDGVVNGVRAILFNTTDTIFYDNSGVEFIRFERDNGVALIPDGTAAAPSVAFSSDPDTGIFLGHANSIALAAGGNQIMRVTTSSMVVQQLIQMLATNGAQILNETPTSTNPVFIPYGGDLTTGIGGTSSNLYLIAGGANVLAVGPGAVHVNISGSAATPALSFNGDWTTGVYHISTGILGVSASGAEILRLGDGTAAEMVLTHATNVNTFRITATHAAYTGNVIQPFITRAASSAFDFMEFVTSAGGVVSYRMTGEGLQHSGLGSAATPGYSFIGRTTDGFYSAGSGSIGIATSGTAKFTIGNSIDGQAGSTAPAMLNELSTSTNPVFAPQKNAPAYGLGGAAGEVSLIGNSLEVLTVGNNTLSFFASAPAAQQDITGSRGGNAALADFLTKMATVGLITDSTTA